LFFVFCPLSVPSSQSANLGCQTFTPGPILSHLPFRPPSPGPLFSNPANPRTIFQQVSFFSTLANGSFRYPCRARSCLVLFFSLYLAVLFIFLRNFPLKCELFSPPRLTTLLWRFLLMCSTSPLQFFLLPPPSLMKLSPPRLLPCCYFPLILWLSLC